MAFNQAIIPPKPRDPGAVAATVSLQRQVQTTTATAGIVGGGASVTGMLLETADSDPRVYIQGPLGNLPGGEGLFATDGAGNVVVSLTTTDGLDLTAGVLPSSHYTAASYEAINWLYQGILKSHVVGYWRHDINTNGGILWLEAQSTDTTHASRIVIYGDNNDTWSSIDFFLDYGSGGSSTYHGVICRGADGKAMFPVSIGQFGQYGPTTKPAAPSTLTDVITILQAYNMCS